MARIIRHTEQAPQRIPMADIKADLYLCRCGLSQNGIFCDGSHRATKDEVPGATYHYSRSEGVLQRTIIVPTNIPTPVLDETVAEEIGGAQ